MSWALEFIERKRDGLSHSDEEIRKFVEAVRDGDMPDYQISAWLMAAFLRGFDGDELRAFTAALASSGDVVSLPGGAVVDKHSTGGVGDKTTLVVAPLVAACGLRVAKLSGRGLGFTGGTVDKLESIPGMDLHLTTERFMRQADELGIALSGHSLALAPAEGKFYAMRDVTGTVPSIPLIASSIVSKKIAGGASAFVFDVKCGAGAFMRTKGEAEKLARALVDLSASLDRKSSCLISDMENPLGEWVGNSAEVVEAVDVLSGNGPDDTRELCLALASEMLLQGGAVSDAESAVAMATGALDCGAGLSKFEALIRAQGGDGDVCAAPKKILPLASRKKVIESARAGRVERMDARSAGEAVRALGGGRSRKEDAVDPSVALRILKKTGDAVDRGEPLAEAFFNDESKLESALRYLDSMYSVGSESVKRRKLILGRVG
ncbi:MAG: thymidine phosphorylase [Synergistaceae bacterium]|jgi:pyrimidine-nucleoside phosphorylase|nr:thymidine phosphorylase [Synergistaceae bacterium]